MKDSLKFCKFGEVAEIFAGGDKPNNFSPIKIGKYQIPVFANGETNNGLQGFTDIAKVNKPSVTVSARGTIGYTVLRVEPFVPIVRLLTLTPYSEKLDIKYLYYYLNLFRQTGLGSSQAQLTVPDISNKRILLPDLKIQKKIGEALSILDQKIELNNKINSELEKIAKTIYDYWFVQFDFPDKNGKPYKTNGGKMVWSKELKKDIPDGWGDKKLKDILKKNNKKFNLDGGKYNIDTIDLSVMPNSTMCLMEKNTSDKFGTNLFEMSRFDILFGGIRPYLLKAGFAPFDGLVTGTVHSFKVIKDFNYNFSLLTIIHDNVFKFAVSNSKGTKMPVISSDDLLEYKFAYEENVVKKFNELISFKEIISKNITENHKLDELRDWLLPMLINGQVG